MSDEKNMPQGEEQEEILNETELEEVAGGATTEPRNPFPKGLAANSGVDESLLKVAKPVLDFRRL